MRPFSISITKPNTVKYPLHQHPTWEIMYYLKGEGYLNTANGKIPFSPHTIIIVPPRIIHGSVGESEFVNISISWDFGRMFMYDDIVVQQDDSALNGERLAKLIFDNRMVETEYLESLCNTYAFFLINNASYEKKINRETYKIVKEITHNYHDPFFDVTKLLNDSNYSEDYIRAEFKKIFHLSPIEFLTKTRIEHAKKLLEIYSSSLAVSQVAEMCGFDDVCYFSRRFKQFTGMSPAEYKKRYT